MKMAISQQTFVHFSMEIKCYASLTDRIFRITGNHSSGEVTIDYRQEAVYNTKRL
jgi:hypothetical protein